VALPKTLTNFYKCIESILSGCITAWYGNCTVHSRRGLQRVVISAQCITGGIMPALQDIYNTQCLRKAEKIIKDTSHGLFTLLPSRRQKLYRCLKGGTKRQKQLLSPGHQTVK
jgi:hypothetical protein